MTMRRILATAAALCLGGCITVYAQPVKNGGQQQQGSAVPGSSRVDERTDIDLIHRNRKPDELLNAVALVFQEQAITASVNDLPAGLSPVPR